MKFSVESEGFCLIYDKHEWIITSPHHLTKRIIWLMNQIQELEREYKKRDNQANIKGITHD